MTKKPRKKARPRPRDDAKPRARKKTPDRTLSAKVACPECGRPFSARGLATHRRLKHPAPSPAPPDAAPAPAAGTAAGTAVGTAVGTDSLEETSIRLRATLDAICTTLDRLDVRLDRLEHLHHGDAVDTPTELDRLRTELEQVLSHISTVKAEHHALEQADGSPERRHECSRELGRLRLRQARLLYFMGSGAPGADPDSKPDGLELL